MTKNEYIASIMLEAADLLKNDTESLNEGMIKDRFKKLGNRFMDWATKENKDKLERRGISNNKLPNNKTNEKPKSESDILWKECEKQKDIYEKQIINELEKIKLPKHIDDELKPMSEKQLIKVLLNDFRYMIKKVNSNSSIMNKCKKIVQAYQKYYNKLHNSNLSDDFDRFECDYISSDEAIGVIYDDAARFILDDIIRYIGEFVEDNLLGYIKFTCTGTETYGALYIDV